MIRATSAVHSKCPRLFYLTQLSMKPQKKRTRLTTNVARASLPDRLPKSVTHFLLETCQQLSEDCRDDFNNFYIYRGESIYPHPFIRARLTTWNLPPKFKLALFYVPFANIFSARAAIGPAASRHRRQVPHERYKKECKWNFRVSWKD